MQTKRCRVITDTGEALYWDISPKTYYEARDKSYLNDPKYDKYKNKP